MDKFFLNIDNSVTGQSWLDALDFSARGQSAQWQQKFGFSSVLANILAARGVEEANLYSYLEPKLRELLPEPNSFKDMDKALLRIIAAIEGQEKIIIYGDYDVDGACASALMWRFLQAIGTSCSIHIPHRIKEGYGLNAEVLQRLECEGYSLIIAVDCGTNDGAAMAELKAGVDLIIFDHHKESMLNEHAYAIVNPSQASDNTGCFYLCAAGVVFIALVGLASRLRDKRPVPNMLSFLDLVALATICDIVPLVGVNRAFITAGLKVARKFANCGIQALAKIAKINEPLSTYHFGYVLGPYINAAGRIDDSSLGVKLLCCDNIKEAEVAALHLQAINKQRQEMERSELDNLVFALHSKFEKQDLAPAIVEMGEWHAGIVGLLAGRLKDRYKRPVIILTKKPNVTAAGSAVGAVATAVGSARAIKGIDIGDLINRGVAQGLVLKGGGHAMAAGLTIEQDKVPAFTTWLCEEIRMKCGEFYEREVLKIDAAISARGANELLCAEIEKAGPYGAGNHRPVFVLSAHKISFTRNIGEKHMAVSLQDNSGYKLKAVAFNVVDSPLGNFLQENVGNAVHVAGYLSLHSYRNTRYAQLTIIDAAAIC